MATEAGFLWHLQERLKHEHLFVTKEKEAIANLNSEIQCTCEKLFHVSWITRQQWKLVQRVRASPEKCSYASILLDRARFVDANKFLGHLESRYGDFLRSLRENPRIVASCLAYTDKLNIDTTQVIRLLLNSVYGNCLLPEDESYALLLMKYLIDCNISVGENLEGFFQHHRNSFTTLFSVLVESLFSAKLYLTAALHAPIMQVLTEDSLLQAKLPFICNKFVKSLESKLYCFPPSLRWLVSQFHNLLLSSCQLERNVARSMVLKLLFDFLVCPAIIRPEQFGVTSDIQISDIALKNLQQIASCLLCSSTERESPRAAGVFSRVDLDCFTSFLDNILRGQNDLPNCPDPDSPPGLCRSSVLITDNDLRALICFLRMIEHGEEHKGMVDQDAVKVILAHLPKQDLNNVSPKYSQQPTIPSSPSMSAADSPKPRSKHRFQKIIPKKKHSTTEMPNIETSGKEERRPSILVDEVTSPMSVFEECKYELMKRLQAVIEEEEEVMVISLGYSAIECPGMQSEETVLGLRSNVKEEKYHGYVTRQRSSSSKFSHDILTKSIEEVAKEKLQVSGGALVELEESSRNLERVAGHNHSIQAELLEPVTVSQNVEQRDLLTPELSYVNVDHTSSATQATHFNTTAVGARADSSQQEKRHTMNRSDADLIDFSSEPPPDNRLTSLDLSKTQVNGIRDSSCSTCSSARDSTFSNCSSLISDMGREGFSDSNLDFGGIPEEQGGDDINFRKRTSHIALRHNENASSVDTLAADEHTSHRDSQASVDSAEAVTVPALSSSSSAQEEEPEKREAIGGLQRKRNTLKGKLSRKTKSLGRGDAVKVNKAVRRFRSGSQNEDNTEKKGNLFGRMKKVKRRGNRTSKQSGPRVYSKLAEDSFAITQSIPHLTVEEKTPKDIIEEIMKKYIVMSGQPETSEDAEDPQDFDDEDDGGTFGEDDQFIDAKRKLRLVLCRADFQSLPWLLAEEKQPRQREAAPAGSEAQELLTFLHVQLAEAINLQDRSLAAQLHETIRRVKELPNERCTRLLNSLDEDYRTRSPYLAYLIRSRQGLLATQDHMESIMDKVDRDKAICSKFFTMTCVNLFLEEKVKEINSFANHFQNLPTSDEKRELMDNFLRYLENEVVQHPIWIGASDEQHLDVFMAIERAVMSRIFKFAFYPNGEVDMERDRTFLEHVKELQKVVSINHKAVRIPKVYRKEAPWESAQKELLNINAYKTPTDKLKCVQQCCSTIMNLLSMASETSVPGADDFFPVMVYVVIHANPPSLLSTVQYISNFYSDRLGGEEAYCWMQYCGAIEFIKTLRSSQN